ncbi:hypothetical protein VTL71DRAFT_4015 [Oculimacula yallundae]|uniref:Uncharacterized protein n=1 Tax=Oculimacula yallundae TaxID=86028 RepID=A0ABR4C4L4_9HELO
MSKVPQYPFTSLFLSLPPLVITHRPLSNSFCPVRLRQLLPVDISVLRVLSYRRCFRIFCFTIRILVFQQVKQSSAILFADITIFETFPSTNYPLSQALP